MLLLSNKTQTQTIIFQVDFLAGVFGISAWLSVNALYTQLPILVQSAPEGWSLPSYLSVAIQLANLGPILYSLSQKYCPRFISDSKLIYFVLVLGSVSLVLMGLYYNVTWFVLGMTGSVVLWILAFCVALVGCTSSVLFIPFMNHYAEIYLISYMVGEGLGGFFPSIISLIQGVGGNPSCMNTTTSTGETVITSYYPDPNFSIKTFFYIMFGFMAVSTIAFALLNNLPSCKRQKIKKPLTERSVSEHTHSPRLVVYQEPETFISSPETFSPRTLLILTAVLSAFSNGALPSVQSYSCLPYGNVAYHLAVNLCNMANPAACFIAYFVPNISKKWTSSLVLLCAVSVTYVLTTASLSPHPPLQNSNLGVVLIVSVLSLILLTVPYSL